MSPGPPKHVAM